MLVFIIIILAKQAEMELFGNLQAMKCSNKWYLFVIYKTCIIKTFYICWGEGRGELKMDSGR